MEQVCRGLLSVRGVVVRGGDELDGVWGAGGS